MKPKILVCTEFTQLSTGYSTYGRDLISGLLARGFDVSEMAIFCNPEDPRINNVPWNVYPVEPPQSNQEAMNQHRSNPQNEFGAAVFDSILLDGNFNIVINFSDFWMLEYQKNSPYRRFFNWLIMPAIDAIPLQSSWIDICRNADGALGYCDWGLDVLREYSGNRVNTLEASPPCSSGYERRNKKELQTRLGLGDDIFIVGTVMRNQRRKLFPSLMKSFREFLDKTGRKNVYLYCHTGYPDLGWDLPELILENGLSSKVIITYRCKNCPNIESTFYRGVDTTCHKCGGQLSLANSSRPISTSELCNIYNTFDLYIQYSIMEGFGIPQIEAGLCGVPVMSVDYSAMSDVVRKINGTPIKVKEFYKELETGRMIAIPDDNHLIDLMTEFFNKSQSERNRLSDLVELTTKSNYNLDSTINSWVKAIQSCKQKEDWNSPPRLWNIPQELPKGLSNTEFAKFIILSVLNQPELLGSYVEYRMLRDLNDKYTRQHFGGIYLSEMSIQGTKNIPQLNQETLFMHFKSLAEKSLSFEKKRCGIE